MKLIKLDNYQIVIEDELLLLLPFKKLYKKDKSRDKSAFMNFLTILYFTYDPRSDYSYIINEKARLNEVCTSNGMQIPKFSKDELDCIELYKKLTITKSQELLQSTKVAIEKVRQFLESVDLTLTDDKGRPIYTINSITSAIKQIPTLAKDVIDAEKAVAKEIEEQSKARGNSELSLCDKGILI